MNDAHDPTLADAIANDRLDPLDSAWLRAALEMLSQRRYELGQPTVKK